MRLPLLGQRSARRWYWGQALRSVISVRRGSGRTDLKGQHMLAALTEALDDLRYGFRNLVGAPAFALLTIGTLGLAIGVNSAIFSMMNVVLIRDLPIHNPETLGFVYMANPQQNINRNPVSEADFLDMRRELASFSEIGALDRGARSVLTGLDEPVRVSGFIGTANILDLWGTEVILGRGFAPGDDAPGAERIALLSHGSWERRFASSPDVIGRAIRIDGFETTIVGVLDPEIEFGSLAQAEIWLPLRLDEGRASRLNQRFWITGKLSNGATLAQAQQEMAAFGERLRAEYPESHSVWRPIVVSMHDALAADNVWTMMYLLMVTVGFVMLIACSNVVTMMLARGAGRAKEIAVRAALGAGRGRLLRHLLAESSLLSIAAGILGLALARLSLLGLVWLSGSNDGFTNFFELVEIDRNVLLFTLAVSLLAPLLFGFLPAVWSSRADLHEILKEGARGGSQGGAARGRRALVATQVALALSLMVVAGLLIRTMIDSRTLDFGFETGGLLTMELSLPEASYSELPQATQFFDQALERVRALPGVDAATWMSQRFAGGTSVSRTFAIEGEPVPQAENQPWASLLVVGNQATDVLRLPLIRGRDLAAADTFETSPVALVNQDMVDRYWGGKDPLGQRIAIDSETGDARWTQIVGVVGNIATGNPDSPTAPSLFVPLAQNPTRDMALLVRAVGETDPLALSTPVRQQIWALDPDQPVADVRTLTQIIADQLSTQEVIFTMFVVFAVFALGMASAGIYGVVSFSVAERTREIGIRMALGARETNIISMVGSQILWLFVFGIAVGSVAAFGLSQVLAGAVAGMATADPLALGGVTLVLALATAIAVWFPTRRAIGIDPVSALRDDA